MSHTGTAVVELGPGRTLTLPSWVRARIPAADLRSGLVLTRGFERCVYLFGREEWERVLELFARVSLGAFRARMLERLLVGGAFEVGVGRAGRLRVPEEVRQWAGLSSRVLVMGVGRRVELWSPERWAALRGPALARYEELAEGFFGLLADGGS